MNSIRNRMSLVAAVTIVAAGSAFATAAMAHSFGEAYPGNESAAVGGATRADVSAATRSARTHGELRLNDADYYRAAPFVAGRSRADVRGEAARAARSGDSLTYHGEADDRASGARGVRPVKQPSLNG